MKQIVLAGAAVTAEILHSYLAADARYRVVGVTVDDAFAAGEGVGTLDTVPLSRLVEAHPPETCAVVMAMGYHDLNRSRESMFRRLKEMGYTIETYVHPDARVYTQYPLGEGCVILPSAVVEPHVRVGANTAVWCNVTLAHHCTVGEHCWIASGAVISGQAEVRRNAFVGVNSTVVNKVVVEEFNIIGAGALISKSTKPSTVHLARSAEEVRFTAEQYVKFIGF